MTKITVLAIFALFCATNWKCAAQVEYSGKCRNLPVVSPFNVQKYLGTWFEIEKYPAGFESGSKCMYNQYSDNHNGTYQVRKFRVSLATNKQIEIIGIGRLKDPAKNEGKFQVYFPVAGNVETGYWVLKTDYNSFSISSSCVQKGDKNYQFLFYLSRTQNPSHTQRKLVRDLMERLELDTRFLTTTDQTNCPRIHS